jgi:sporulation related protein
MADDDFRSYRNRDAMAPRSAATPSRPHSDDPLAELARLIGQSEPPGDYDREARNGPSLDVPAEGVDWAAEDRYADQSEPAEGAYDARGDDRYPPAQQADIVPTFRAGVSYDSEAEPQLDGQFSPPARSFNGARDYGLPERPRFRDEQEPVGSLGRQLPGFAPRSRDERDYDDPAQQGVEDQDYALEDYEEEAPAGRRRSGFVVIAAVLGLAVLGTAGAFAYRAMFGSSMLPSLPPIIKADDGPNKIVPTKPKSNASDQADANSPSGEKLVSREEQPVDVPAPANQTPRAVSTIPIFPDPNSGQAGVPSSAQGAGLASGAPSAPAPTAPVQANVIPAAPAASIWPPASSVQPAAPAPAADAASASPAAFSTAPRKVHTVIIRSDQVGPATADASSSAAPAEPTAPAPAPVRVAPPRAAAQPATRPMSAPRPEANGPLSIVPDQDSAAPAPRVRTALARPTEPNASERTEAPPSAGGGYSVQVTSQRSEAGAQAEFRALRAKFPTQLGSREPIIRRADLGAKGVYYRALVGPFASMDQAAGVCTSLKAAGGTCIVQRD